MFEHNNNLLNLTEFLEPSDLKSFPLLYEVVQSSPGGFEAIKLLLSIHQSGALYIPKLTSIPATRKRAILHYASLGYSSNRIARVLHLSEKLVKDTIKETKL